MGKQSNGCASLAKRVFGETQGARGRLLAIFIMEILGTPLSLLSPLAIKIAIDSVIGGKPLFAALRAILPSAAYNSRLHLLFVAAALQVLIVLLLQLHSFSNYILKTTTGEHLILAFRKKLFRHLQRLPLVYHDTHGTPDSSFRLQDEAPAIKSITVDGALFLLSDVIKLVAIGVITAFIDWRLSLLAMSISPLLVLYAVIYQRRVGGRYREVRRIESSALKMAQEALSAIRVVKAFGQEGTEENRFVERSQEGHRKKISLAYADGLFGLAINVTTAFGMALVLFFGIRSVLAGLVTLGSLLMITTYLCQLYAPLQNITFHIASLQTSAASMDRALEILREHPESDHSVRPGSVRDSSPASLRAAGTIEFRRVHFSYNAERPVLRNLSLLIPAGTKVGLVGRTGAGKTTFVNMLLRFHDPQSGQVLLDGTDLREYSLAALRSQFAVVLQDPGLSSATVAQNIAYGNPSASIHEIVEAARAANAHDFILRLPRGYDTELGERGTLISGGERQRISIARAYLKDAPILILDEPTSALDSKTEGDILRAMNRLMAGRTTFFISHRLNALADCDLLLKIDQGTAVEGPVPRSVFEIESFVYGMPPAPAQERRLVDVASTQVA